MKQNAVSPSYLCLILLFSAEMTVNCLLTIKSLATRHDLAIDMILQYMMTVGMIIQYIMTYI